MSKLYALPWPSQTKTPEDRQREQDPDGLTFKERAQVAEAQRILEEARARKSGVALPLKSGNPLTLSSALILTLNQAN